ncbi:hypothetical protein E1211_25885 [Micromonospora sp. 15K316]|uniref:hypothetical protein n=1 Tax=Micromonospora sp. 15K316 TaxID=2530376 RepID=UPI001045130E|nr:hypothetical protein [Micromonospora sp. 15K316]TDC29492.1 hypothetical protein E1211_25885 [Micromonospora sp. 15K316]
MCLPDIVVPVRVGAVNEQLRYALRSWAAHLPHRHVWVVGYQPPWLTGVRHLSTQQAGHTKYRNTTTAVRAVCEHPEVSDPFLLCNDDFFVMQPVERMPVLHRGPVAEVERYYATRGSGKYLRGMRETRDLLAELGHSDPLSYELHVPLPVDKAGMLRALDAGRHLDVIHKRTMYGNLAALGGTRAADVKVLGRSGAFDRASPFLSTMVDSFARGAVGAFIRGRFPGPSPYEQPGRR